MLYVKLDRSRTFIYLLPDSSVIHVKAHDQPTHFGDSGIHEQTLLHM